MTANYWDASILRQGNLMMNRNAQAEHPYGTITQGDKVSGLKKPGSISFPHFKTVALNESIQWQCLGAESIKYSLVPYILTNYKAELQSSSEEQHLCWINNIPRPWIAANIHFQLSYLFYRRCQIKEPFTFWNFSFSL